jgi:hypothetical protein
MPQQQNSTINLHFRKEQLQELNELKATNELMRKLSTRLGFYDYYFQMCKDLDTKEIAFNKANELYFKLFLEFRYKDFNSFQMSINFYSKIELKN